MIPLATSFVAGLLLAFLPSYAPFLGAIYFLSSRFRLHPNDLWWFGAALLMCVPVLLHGDFLAALLSLVQILAVWLIYRAFSTLPRPDHPLQQRLMAGLLTGLFLVVVFGALQIEQLNFAYRSVVQAIVWNGNPTLYGHSVLALGVAIATLSPGFRQKVLALSLSALGILISGSREAGMAWLIFAVAMTFLDSRLRGTRQRAFLFVSTVVMLGVAAGLGAFLGWGTSGFLIDIVPVAGSDRNLIQSSELPQSDWWYRQLVDVTAEDVTIAGQTLTGYTITKTAPDSWARFQQIVPLEPSVTYTISAWLEQQAGETRPGIQGWASLPDDKLFTLIASQNGEDLRVRMQGPGEIIKAGIADEQDSWQRIFITFEYSGTTTAYWYVGLAPDDRFVSGTSSRFAGFQVMRTDELLDYVPGGASRGVDLEVARVPYWNAAWQGFLSSPLLGSATDFTQYFMDNWPERHRFHITPAHAHSFPLQMAYERGLFGLAGASLFLIALLMPAARRRDWLTLMAVLAVLLANIFDLTLLYGGVIYPLAAMVGWRSNVTTTELPANRESYRMLVSRTALAAGDAAGVLLSLALSRLLLSWFGVGSAEMGLLAGNLAFVLLLWPILVLREGLYPGYGIPAHIELKKHFTAASMAWLITAAGSLLFRAQVGTSTSLLAMLLPVTLIILPLLRLTVKRVLLQLGLWGERVVILGSQKATTDISGMLQRHPAFGYLPSTTFGPAEGGGNSGGEVREAVRLASAYALEHGLSHAIVVLSSDFDADPASLTGTTESPFRKVEFIPELGRLPVYSVQASSIDNVFALQVRNELLSPSKQAYKRLIDLSGALIGGILISPLLLLLMIAIRADSPGPVFFGHKRIGRDGRTFQAWKFRSMVKDADSALAAYLERHPELKPEWEANQKLQNDPRVTRVGRFLRKYSLDELPQLWNVLLGEMSLVGPRPIVADEIPRYREAFEIYKAVLPGMTGYWQVSGRSDTDYDRRVELDSFYVRNWSVWLDIIIILRTVKVVVKGDGAY